MKFWDTSALVPLVTKEDRTPDVQRLLADDRNIAVAFMTPLELASTLWKRGRRWRDQAAFRRSLFKAAELEANWTSFDEFEPAIKLARQLVTQYVLRSADAIQLAAALSFIDGHPEDLPFVTLDNDLRSAARAEGFAVLP